MAIEETQRGVVNNPFHIIGASERIGPDAIIVENTSAAAGIVAQVIGPNKIIMDTGYFPANSLLGPVRITSVFFSNVEDDDILTLEIWRKNEAGYEENVYTDSIEFIDNMSNTFGGAFEKVYQTNNNQYRYILKSGSGNATDTTVGIDNIKLETISPYAVSAHTQYSKWDKSETTGTPRDYTVDSIITTTLPTTGFVGATITFVTEYSCIDASIVAMPHTTTDLLFMAITNKTTTGFSIYVQQAGGAPFVGDMRLNIIVMFDRVRTSI